MTPDPAAVLAFMRECRDRFGWTEEAEYVFAATIHFGGTPEARDVAEAVWRESFQGEPC